ncbi:MAG: L,D-transpeptidase family protein [Chromatiaceae bacterium]|nr:L,D-transpeptidase family protein [Chromatiaceae bacterium]
MGSDKKIAPVNAVSVAVGYRVSLGTSTRRPIVLFLALLMAVVLAGCAGGTQKPAQVDQVVVKKSERKIELIQNGKVLREFRIALGDRPRGHKMKEGDERTPEGEYILDWRNPNSRFYKSIHVSYPNDRDIRFARLMGTDPGGMIMIHGQPNYIRSAKVMAEYQRRDWTNGCIAVQNHEMDVIWQTVRDGTPIKILP